MEFDNHYIGIIINILVIIGAIPVAMVLASFLHGMVSYLIKASQMKEIYTIVKSLNSAQERETSQIRNNTHSSPTTSLEKFLFP